MIDRIIEKSIQDNLFAGKVIILYGARQVGKTTLVKDLMARVGKTAKYINCDLIENRQALASQSLERLKSFIGFCELLVIDEAQRVSDIGINLKIIHDNIPGLQVIATGSSSFDLANRVNEPLTGRVLEYFLAPFSFEEVILNAQEPASAMERALRFGLYPDIVHRAEEDARTTLGMLAGNYLYKYILEFEKLRRSDQLVGLLQLLALQVGQEVSLNELGGRLKLNALTVQKYIDLLEKTFVIFRLRAFSRNLRKEISKSNKIYFWDIGIRNALIQNHNPLALRADVGALWENFCVAERIKFNRCHGRAANLYFWRTYDKKEIDLVEERDGALQAFEFKWNPQRNARPPAEFLKTYPGSSFSVVTPQSVIPFLSTSS